MIVRWNHKVFGRVVAQVEDIPDDHPSLATWLAAELCQTVDTEPVKLAILNEE